MLVQRGEISLADEKKPKKEASTVSEKKAARKGTRIKALSPKIQRDETLEVCTYLTIYTVYVLIDSF